MFRTFLKLKKCHGFCLDSRKIFDLLQRLQVIGDNMNIHLKFCKVNACKQDVESFISSLQVLTEMSEDPKVCGLLYMEVVIQPPETPDTEPLSLKAQLDKVTSEEEISNLLQHVIQDKKVLDCPLCSKSFGVHKNLNAHLRRWCPLIKIARTLIESREKDTGNLSPETGSSATSTSTPVSQETEADVSCTPETGSSATSTPVSQETEADATTLPGESESISLLIVFWVT
jgi:hypothetical protein